MIQPEEADFSILDEAGDADVDITGVVISDPDKIGRIKYALIDSEHARIGQKDILFEDRVSISLPAGYTLFYGDRIQATGKLNRTFEKDDNPLSTQLGKNAVYFEMSFPEVEVLSHGNASRLMDATFRFKKIAHQTIYHIMPFPESALLSGILLGIDSEMPDLLLDAYRTSGTFHIIVISGFNITLVTVFLFRIFRKVFNQIWAILGSAMAILLYMFMVGAEPPVVRAAFMGIAAMPAYTVGRKVIGFHNLTLTAALMLLINPFLFWQASFQLSFLATLALMTLMDPIEKWLKHQLDKRFPEEKTALLMEPLVLIISTAVVSIILFPILFQFDARLSTISLLTNFLILPLQPVIMVTGVLAVTIGLFVPLIGRALGVIPWAFLALTNQIVFRFSMSRFASLPLPDWIFWVSCVLSFTLLISASSHQLYRLIHPTKKG